MGNYRNNRKNKVKAERYIPPFEAELLNRPIEELKLHPVCLKHLKSGNINLVVDLVSKQEKELFCIPHFNKRSFEEVTNKLKAQNMYIRPTVVAQKPAENSEKSAQAGDKEGKNQSKSAQKQGDKKSSKPQTQSDNLSKNTQEGRQQNSGGKQGKRGRDGRNSENQDNRRDKQQKSDRSNGRPLPRKERVEVLQDIYVKINKNNKWGFMDRSGKEVVPAVYDEVFTFHEDLCCVEQNERVGYINREGEVVIPIIYDLGMSFSDGVACVFKNGKCGYINKNGETVVDFRYDAGTTAEGGSCHIKKEGNWGELTFADLVSAEGEAVLNPDSVVRWI